MTDAAELQYLREFKKHALAVFEKYLNTPESRALRQLAFEVERERLILSGGVESRHAIKVGMPEARSGSHTCGPIVPQGGSAFSPLKSISRSSARPAQLTFRR